MSPLAGRIPGDLEGKKDATLTCTAAVAGRSYPVNVRVTEVKGSDVRYSWQMDTSGVSSTKPSSSSKPAATPTPSDEPAPTDEPTPDDETPAPTSGAQVVVSQQNVENEIARAVREQTGKDAGVDCPGSLPGQVGRSLVCKLAISGNPNQENYRITVTRVEGKEVYFDIKKA